MSRSLHVISQFHSLHGMKGTHKKEQLEVCEFTSKHTPCLCFPSSGIRNRSTKIEWGALLPLVPFLTETRKHWKSHRKDPLQQQIFRYASNERRVLGNYLSLGQISLAMVNYAICFWSLMNTYSLVWLSSTCKHFFHFLWISQKTQYPETPKKLRSLKLLKMGPKCLRIDFFFPYEKPGHSKVGY